MWSFLKEQDLNQTILQLIPCGGGSLLPVPAVSGFVTDHAKVCVQACEQTAQFLYAQTQAGSIFVEKLSVVLLQQLSGMLCVNF